MGIQIQNRLLEDRLMDSLEKRKLKSSRKNLIDYDHEENFNTFLGKYNKGRTWFMGNLAFRAIDNAVPLAIGGIALAGGMLYFIPETQKTLDTAKVLGGLSILVLGAKTFIPLDKLATSTSAESATAIYKNCSAPWKNAYFGLKIRNVNDLNRLIKMTKGANSVVEKYSSQKHQKTLGIYISRLTDFLSEIYVHSRSLKGFRPHDLLEIIEDQKVGNRIENQSIDSLMQDFSRRQLVRILNQDKKEPEKVKQALGEAYKALETLKKYYYNHEFGLRVSDVSKIMFIASQISFGRLDVDGDVGDLAGIYAGKHSNGDAFPRVYIHGSAGRSFFSKSTFGYGHVRDSVKYGLKDGSDGSCVQIDDIVHGAFACNMDHKTSPSIIASIGGVTHEPKRGQTKNGIIFSLNENVGIDRPPKVYYFHEGEMTYRTLTTGDGIIQQTASLSDRYIQAWPEQISLD